MPQDSPRFIGHRGAPREYPENTLPSFVRALELGADGIELDVHATRDGVSVVHHDPVVRAHSPDTRLARRVIAEVSYAELRSLEVAPGVGIPTLADVLALAVGTSTIVYVELKGAGIESQVVDVIRAGGADCAIHSFDHAAVARARLLAPEIRRGLLFSRRRPRDPAGALEIAGALDAWPEWTLVDESLVDAVHRIGGSVIAWTVNDAATARRLIQMGVDGICTDELRVVRPPST